MIEAVRRKRISLVEEKKKVNRKIARKGEPSYAKGLKEYQWAIRPVGTYVLSRPCIRFVGLSQIVFQRCYTMYRRNRWKEHCSLRPSAATEEDSS